MSKTAFVFPGQGSQHPGMGREMAECWEVARETFLEADESLGTSLSGLCFQGSKGELSLTENTQPAVLVTSLAVWRVLESMGHKPDLVAGHSLGEYSACVVAGGLSLADAVPLVRRRGRFMQEAVAVGEGAMAAILGLELEQVERACRQSAGGQVVAPANVNSPRQIVVAGHREAVERTGQMARKMGARKVIPLSVSAPFHCPLMEPARRRLARAMEGVRFRDLEIPLVNNAEAALLREAREVREGLIRQVTATVLWSRSVEVLWEQGVRTFVELGPGRVLGGLIRRIVPQARTVSIETPRQLEEYVGLS